MYDYIKTVVSYVVGSSLYPYVPELFTGTWPWIVDPGGPEDEEFVAKAVLMHGIKGFSRYVLVERDRWIASPIRRDASVREGKYEVFHRTNALASEHRLADLRWRADVLLLGNREYDRLEAARVLVSYPGDFLETTTTFPGYPSAMTASENLLGFEEPVQLVKSDRFADYYRGLTDAGYAFLASDTALSPERWQDYKAVVIGSFEYMDASLQRDLVPFAIDGGLVILGPRVPHLNGSMHEDETLRSALQEGDREPLTADGAEVALIPSGAAGSRASRTSPTRQGRWRRPCGTSPRPASPRRTPA
jgi:beta-galactosidase